MLLRPNTTFDLYHAGNDRPGVPDAAGVPGYLQSDFRRGLEAGQGIADSDHRFTHWLLAPATLDVRDAYDNGSMHPSVVPDIVYIPSQLGTQFRVVFAERRFRGGPFDHLRIYLARVLVLWPSDSV